MTFLTTLLPSALVNSDTPADHITTRWGQIEPVYAGFAGRLAEVAAPQGSTVFKGDAVAYIERE